MGLRYNPPPGWPPAPPGFTPPPGWQPDPSWPPPPPGWQLWVNDDQPPASAPTTPPLPGYSPGSATGTGAYWGGGYGNPGSPYAGGASYAHPDAPNARPDSAYAPPPGPYGGAPGPYGTGPYTPGMPPGSGETSGWAIASFILGVIPVSILLSVIFGAVALSRIKRLGQRGKGLAIAGIALSAAWIALFIILAVIGSLGQASRSSSTGKITHTGQLSVFSLAVGDCFDNPANESTVTTVTAIPCNQAHNAQIYAKFNLTGSDLNFPGTSTVNRLASVGCNARTGSVNKSAAPSSVTIRLLFPEQGAWLNGQRTVSCMIVDSTPDLTSSLVN
jgi:hypothetical protein